MTKHKGLLALELIAVTLLAAAVGANLYAILVMYRDGFRQTVAGLMCLTSGYAIYYILTGGTKQRSAGYFQSFLVMFALCEFLLLVEKRQDLYWMLPAALSFGCLCAVAITKDLGKVKSLVLASAVTACQIFRFVISVVMRSGKMDFRPAMGMFLGFVAVLLIVAKYQDKADRAAEAEAAVEIPIPEASEEAEVTEEAEATEEAPEV